ncbi:MAG: 3-isopropylmalate dehydratase small subunit, partial [Cyclobacteriaceae bacterium]
TLVEIDIHKQTITILSTGKHESFIINEYKKGNMKNGFDDIDYLLNLKEEIRTFAEKGEY